MAISSRRSLVEKMTRQEIEQKMDELAREYHETHDPEIPEEIFELARRLPVSQSLVDFSWSLAMFKMIRIGPLTVCISCLSFLRIESLKNRIIVTRFS
jgi:hypothetical protein